MAIKFLTLLTAFFLTACGSSDMSNKPTIELKLESTIQKTLSSTSIKFIKDCNSAFCVYDFDLPSASANLVTANVISDTKNLHLNKVSGIKIFATPSGTITSFIIFVVGVPSNAPHQDALVFFQQQLKDLSTAGWQRYIYPNEARIPGSEARKFNSKDEILGKPVGTGPWNDPDVTLSTTEWTSMPAFNTWMFFNIDEYLDFTVQRELSDKDPVNLGSYLFTMTFKSKSEYYEGFVKAEDRERWKELLPAELTRMAQERKATETQLKKMGIKIDENYKDAKPPVDAG